MSSTLIQQVLKRAHQHQQAGRMAEAEKLYRQVLAQAADNDEALHGLAGIAFAAGRPDASIGLLHQAIAVRPGAANYHFNLGRVLLKVGRHESAVAAFDQALALRPDFAEAHNERGIAVANLGRIDDSVAAFSRALALRPEYVEAHNNLGIALTNKGKFDDAIASCRRAIALRPTYAEAFNNLCVALKNAGSFEEACAAGRQAITLNPQMAEGWSNLGLALRGAWKYEDAIAAFRRAVGLWPKSAQMHVNLGVALHEIGRSYEAADCCRAAMAVHPDFPMAHWNLSLIYLQQGDYARGWVEHEWRWQAYIDRMPPRDFAQPRWDGADLSGRRILLHVEQGFGDAIQFARFVPMVAARNGRIVLECQSSLGRLFAGQTWAGVERVVGQGDDLGEFDVHCPLVSLPLAFGTTLATIPAEMPYLRAESGVVDRWRERLRTGSARLNVGLVWAGKTIPDPRRTIGLAGLGPLAEVADVRFVSLQKGGGSEEAQRPPSGMEWVDWTAELTDFADTAALMEALDVVITIDTAAAHLAGALGKRAWVLLPYSPDWRWLRSGETSPWYPTMRLFRQRVFGDWSAPIAEVVEALRSLDMSSGEVGGA
jgi:tetratricopeptide (TPR) repeat protein